MTLLLLTLLAHDLITTKITWTVEIARLVNRRCIACHGSGSPVDFSSYDAARPWAKAIRNQVLQRGMPPWGAMKGYGDFRNDPSLTPLEIETVTQWVEGGAPEGDAAFLPHFHTPVAVEAPRFRWQPVPASLAVASTIHAIRAAGPVEVSASCPDGSIRHLLWIQVKLPNKREYVFREPVALPAGTKMQVTGAKAEWGKP